MREREMNHLYLSELAAYENSLQIGDLIIWNTYDSLGQGINARGGGLIYEVGRIEGLYNGWVLVQFRTGKNSVDVIDFIHQKARKISPVEKDIYARMYHMSEGEIGEVFNMAYHLDYLGLARKFRIDYETAKRKLLFILTNTYWGIDSTTPIPFQKACEADRVYQKILQKIKEEEKNPLEDSKDYEENPEVFMPKKNFV